ncbi:hypothetical protein AYI69_g2231 [Smittium culicis]|uniref:Uncharacterized protein n=1 Tax=Smittium culicis TaxID=133412 RepID=A0A1R1YNI6_9FUNG|nr:hypothetical protein AYI69_g2231 [Smittium culicis]
MLYFTYTYSDPMMQPDFKIKPLNKTSEERLKKIRNRFSKAFDKTKFPINRTSLIQNDSSTPSTSINTKSSDNNDSIITILSTDVNNVSTFPYENKSNSIIELDNTSTDNNNSSEYSSKKQKINTPLKNQSNSQTKLKSILKDSSIISDEKLSDSVYSINQEAFERAQKAVAEREYYIPLNDNSESILNADDSTSINDSKRSISEDLETKIFKKFKAFKKRKNMTLMPSSSSFDDSKSISSKQATARRRSTFGQRGKRASGIGNGYSVNAEVINEVKSAVEGGVMNTSWYNRPKSELTDISLENLNTRRPHPKNIINEKKKSELMELIVKYQEEDRSYNRAQKKDKEIDSTLNNLIQFSAKITNLDVDQIPKLVKSLPDSNLDQDLLNTLDTNCESIYSTSKVLKTNRNLSIDQYLSYFAKNTTFFVDVCNLESNMLASKLEVSHSIANQALAKVSSTFESRNRNNLSATDPQFLLKELSNSLRKTTI